MEAFKSDNKKFADLMYAVEEGVIENTVFRGSYLELTLLVNGVRLTTNRSLERRPVAIGEKMCVLLYRVYLFDEAGADLRKNQLLRGIGGNVRMYAKAVLKPGAKIAWHQHTGETEPYFILSGHGIFTDHDKSRTEVSAGDVCLIQEGQFHSIENASEEDLAFMALIYAVPGDVPAMR